MLNERDIVLGAKNKEYKDWLKEYRLRTSKAAIEAFQHIKRAEKQAFGTNSFFFLLEQGIPSPPEYSSLSEFE